MLSEKVLKTISVWVVLFWFGFLSLKLVISVATPFVPVYERAEVEMLFSLFVASLITLVECFPSYDICIPEIMVLGRSGESAENKS